MRVSNLKYPLLIVAVGLLVGLIGDLSFYDSPFGISIPLFAAAVLIALLGLAAIEDTKVTRANLWLTVPLLFLSAMSAVRAAPFLRFLNISGALLLLILLANQLLDHPLTAMNVGGYLGALIETSLVSTFIPVPLIGRGIASIKESGGSGRTISRVLIGLVIALPFLCIFTVLFASADLIFSNLVEDALEAFNIPDLLGHTFLTLTLGWLVMGGLAYALGRSKEQPSLFASAQPASDPTLDSEDSSETVIAPESDTAARPGIRSWLGIVESSVVLFSVDALFLVFVAIQFATLFGGEAFLRSQGLTYSEYARRGFFELLAVALITLSLILALDFITRRETSRQHLVFMLGTGLMIGLTIVILASAFQRLRLYELAYGFSRLRVYSHVFMAWLAVLFVFFLVILIVQKTRLFATGALLVALGFVVTLNLLNPDVFIFKQNLIRFHDGKQLDVAYLGSLSEDVVPLLIPLLYEYDPEIGAEVGPWLCDHLNRLDKRQEKAGWPSYHVSINRAYRVLDLNRELIEQFELPGRWSGYPEYDIYPTTSAP